MDLKQQIYSLVFSFGFGIFFNLIILFYAKLKKSIEKNILKNTILIILVITNTIIYFFILKQINEGQVHIYFILMIVFGYIISQKYVKEMLKGLHLIDLWYNIFKLKR